VLAHIDDSKGDSFLDCLIREDQKVMSEQQHKKREADRLERRKE